MLGVTKEILQELLVDPGIITLTKFKKIIKKSKKEKKRLYDALVDEGVIKDSQLGRLVAEYFGYKFLDLSREKVDDDVLLKIPEVVAKSQGIVAISRIKSGVKVGMIDPKRKTVLQNIEKLFGENVLPYVVTRRAMLKVLQRYKADISKEFEAILKNIADNKKNFDIRDESIKKIVNLILINAHQNRTSDIHIDPHGKKAIVRYRVDGLLHDVLTLDKPVFESVLARIKILSRMRTDEHRAAQDGKFRFISENKEQVDVRVSVVPTGGSENIVMRLLSSKNRQYSLPHIGLNSENLKKVKEASKNPHGMLLVTGPTGSGKTTTLYAILQILNKREVNIATIEDPVEYDIHGITQIQVNTKTNLTFAKGLRAVVRQDPDIIMVGEIRDEETASIAVNSALTGHLVLSTLHTNNAATALPRLLDMGVEPFLVSSTVNIVIAQRLVRKICPSCISSYKLEKTERASLSKDKKLMSYFKKHGVKSLSSLELYKGTGCKVCANTGYQGRIGVFEVLEMSDNIRQMIMNHANADQITNEAIKEGMTTMLSDGVEKVINGETTLSEILRVTRD